MHICETDVAKERKCTQSQKYWVVGNDEKSRQLRPLAVRQILLGTPPYTITTELSWRKAKHQPNIEFITRPIAAMIYDDPLEIRFACETMHHP